MCRKAKLLVESPVARHLNITASFSPASKGAQRTGSLQPTLQNLIKEFIFHTGIVVDVVVVIIGSDVWQWFWVVTICVCLLSPGPLPQIWTSVSADEYSHPGFGPALAMTSALYKQL